MTSELIGLRCDGTGYLFDADENCIGKTYDKTHAKIIAEAFERDRNKPDVPELVRYTPTYTKLHGIVMADNPNGEYVRYDQAVAVIAAKDDTIYNQDEMIQALTIELATIQEKLKNPDAVHIALLRGDIAKPKVGQLLHIYGGETK